MYVGVVATHICTRYSPPFFFAYDMSTHESVDIRSPLIFFVRRSHKRVDRSLPCFVLE